MKILVLNGPNLNLVGTREPEIYGSESFDTAMPALRARFPEHELHYRQSNVEGQLIDWLQAAAEEGFEGVLINPGGYAHTAVALADALAALRIPVVEVHLSNVHAREPFRHHSTLADKAVGVICGFGPLSYSLALDGLVAHLRTRESR